MFSAIVTCLNTQLDEEKEEEEEVELTLASPLEYFLEVKQGRVLIN